MHGKGVLEHREVTMMLRNACKARIFLEQLPEHRTLNGEDSLPSTEPPAPSLNRGTLVQQGVAGLDEWLRCLERTLEALDREIAARKIGWCKTTYFLDAKTVVVTQQNGEPVTIAETFSNLQDVEQLFLCEVLHAPNVSHIGGWIQLTLVMVTL